MEQDEEMSKQKGFGELSQSRIAIWTAVGIIFAVHIFTIVFSMLARELPSAQLFGTDVSLVIPIAIDLFLGINLLRGKHWARTWMLIRVGLGLLVWGIIAILQKDFTGLVMQVGVCIALLLLLTGTSTRIRMAGSIACFVLLFVGGMVWAAIGYAPTEPTAYEVYRDETSGFWFSHPSDWKEPTEKEMEEMWEQDPGMKAAIEQGLFTVVMFVDPSDSGALAVFTLDFEKIGEPVPALDEDFCSAMVESLAMDFKDFHLVSSKNTKIGSRGEGGEEEAREITFEGKVDGDNGQGNAVVTIHHSRLHFVFFLCDETAYDTLKPAYDTFKETFRFVGTQP